jgi:hypothetical protein
MEMSIHPSSMLGIMFLLHFFADFNLQIGAGLDKFKQWRWWREQIPARKEAEWNQYKNDYKVALWIHSFQWALVTCLPLAMCRGMVYVVSVLAHASAHYIVDDVKANYMRINLIQDQTMHAIQVLLIWAAWLVYK